ncbi:MAG: glycerol-3-phosphate responsive antiterminator [Ktedonobacteraceae bacterium]|nr:glycerol-3-phosphate responsive antiterminator [Ktedonobacteraceae bacterium]MBV9710562.1 glycerol-3-phosphate responsive antiterminator [Ktedonobacteraceae bacterium]
MLTQSCRSLTALQLKYKVIPVVENRVQLAQLLEHSRSKVVLLRHCNLFDFVTLLDTAWQREYTVFVNIDHIDGIYPDSAGLSYLAKRLHITGIVSNHPKILSLGKSFGLETIQRIFAVDSTGLETAVESVDTQYVDLLDISPALVIPSLAADLLRWLPLPFIGSGLISTTRQVEAIVRAGASAVATIRPELWSL